MRDKKTIRVSKLLKLLAHDNQPVTIHIEFYCFGNETVDEREHRYISRNNAISSRFTRDLYVKSFEIGENREIFITATVCKEHAEMI